MASMDIFTGDAFSTFSLTDAINNVPYKPNFLGTLGIFEDKPVRTETIAIESKDNELSIIQTSERGAPLAQAAQGARNIRDFRTVRLAKADTLMASEVQNIRAFGSETELQQVQAESMSRMVSLRNDMDLTHENMRLGAVQGVVTDADGSVIRNWFTEWGITAPTEVSFGLNAPTTDVRAKCHEMVRAAKRAAKGKWAPGTRLVALCGDTFFDKFVGHPMVRDTYLNWQAAAELRGNLAYGEFEFGGIRWVNYQGTDDGEIGIGPDKARFFPINAPGVFQRALSPGESFDWVNTPGQEAYAITIPDRDRNAWVKFELYSYPLYICTRPGMLLRGKV